MHDEMRRIMLASLADYPMLQLQSALGETAKQFTMVETGAGVVRWVMDSYYSIKNYVPAALPAMDASRQHRADIDFTAINRLQVPLAYFAMALLPFIAWFGLRREGFTDIGELAAAAALALLGNAAVFGIFATAHNRYGARMIWIAGFVGLLALARMLQHRRVLHETPALPRLSAARQTVGENGRGRPPFAIVTGE